MKTKVIFQSLDVKRVKKSNIVRGKIVTQWGTQVFEVVNAYYLCNAKNLCALTDYERLATYESCKVKNSKVSCTKKISGEMTESFSRDVITENPDEVINEYDNARVGEDETEFPARIQDEYSDIF